MHASVCQCNTEPLVLTQGLAGASVGISPAPFCCSREAYLPLVRSRTPSVGRRRSARGRGAGNDGSSDEDSEYFVDGNSIDMDLYKDLSGMDESRIEAMLLSQDKLYVDKHVLFHRLYVGLSSVIGLSKEIQEMLASYLPITRAVLVKPTLEGRGQDLVDVWYRAMQDSRKAADDADLIKVPSFHWARMYRI